MLDSLIDHASRQGEIDFVDIAPTVDALTDAGDISLLPRLHEALDRFLDDENFYGRDLIAGVLAGIAGIAALPVLLLAADRDLGDDQDGLQSEIAGLLDDDPKTGRVLILELIHSDVPQRRRAGLLALGSVAEAGDAGLLAEAASHPDSDVRLMAVESVMDPANDDQAFAILADALHDTDETVRMEAISRLGACGRPEAPAALARAATGSQPRVRARIAYALGRLGNPSTTNTLLQLLRDDDNRVRDQARDALGSIGSPAAVDALLNEATAADIRLRSQAAKALAKAVDADPRVEPQILRLVRDHEPAVRAATLSGLASVKAPSTRLSALAVALADDPDVTVRQRVAVIAHHLAPGDANAILCRLTNDAEAIVRQTVNIQLARLSNATAHTTPAGAVRKMV